MNRKINSIALSIILVASTFTILGAFTFIPQQAEAQGLQLRVSAAERPQFQNHFFGPQIVQVVIDDPGATDPDESTVGLQVKGVTVPRVHLSDGLWYHFFAEEAAFGIFMDVMTDGVRNNRIATIFPEDCPDPTLGTCVIGGTTFTIDDGVTDSWIRELTKVGSFIFVEIVQNDVFPTLPQPFFTPPATVINPDLNILGSSTAPGTATCSAAEFAALNDRAALGFPTLDQGCDWPYIRLTGINELDIVAIRAGSASVNLIYDDFNESISSIIDRTAAYPVNAEVIVSYTDFMWNINPVEEDVVSWVLDKGTGLPENVIYRFHREFSADLPGSATTDLLPVLFRPVLNFDTRQVLELDSEGVNTLKFNEFFDPATGLVGNFGTPRTADNSRIVDTSPFALPSSVDFVGLSPVITMIESDPNTSFFESIDEQQGSISGIFTGVNDKVANFDYFDIINSAAMTFHDGFATVDREVYDSADRAVFTVTDPDQNLRSRVSEQPSAIRSNAFVKVGNPFPLGNNPTFANFFGKNTLPTVGTGFNMFSAPARQGIEEVHMTLAFNRASLVTAGHLNADGTIASSNAALTAFIAAELNTGTSGGIVAGDIVVAAGGDADLLTPVSIRINKFPADSFRGGAAAGTASHFVVLDNNNNGRIDFAPSAKTNDAVFIATNGDIFSTNPDRQQTIGLNFVTRGIDNPAPTPDDRPSSILINTEVTLQDLNRFTEFTATGLQIRANNGGTPVITPTPAGQAFPIDPSVARTGLFVQPTTGTPTTLRTHASAGITGVAPLEPAQDTQVFRVMVPQYNLLHANLQELVTQIETGVGGLNFNNVAVQISVDSRGVAGIPVAGQKVVTRMVDFTPFGTTGEGFTDINPTDASGFAVRHIGTTKIGTGSFRVVDFLAADWNGNGTPWPADPAEASLFSSLKVQVTVVFINTSAPGAPEPVEVIGSVDSTSGEATTSHAAAIDIGGIVTVIPPPVVPGGTSTFPAQRTIDEITLLANENLVYRIQVKEQGSNSSIFTGRMDFMTVNQFDTVQRALADIVLSGDPAKALLPNRFIPPNRLAFAYTDVDIVEVFRPTSASFIYETRDGKVEWDRRSFSFGQDAFLTITDEDLNRRPDATERYDLPVAGFVFFELGKKRVADATSAVGQASINLAGTNFVIGNRPCNPNAAPNVAFEFGVCFLSQIDATLLETGPNTGTFVAQITMAPTILVANPPTGEIQGLPTNPLRVDNVQQQDLEANYIDVRDRSSIRQEFDDITNVRTTLGDVVLDRAAYPPGAIMYVEIHDNDFNTDVDIRESIDLNTLVASTEQTIAGTQISEGTTFTVANGDIPATCLVPPNGLGIPGSLISTGACAELFPIVEINIFQSGVGRLVTLLPVGLTTPLGTAAGTPNVLVDRFGAGVTVVATGTTLQIIPIVDRFGNFVTEAVETGPNTGIFEFEVQLPGPTNLLPNGQPEPRFPIDLPDIVTTGSLSNPTIRSNMPIQVTYFDPSDESGEAEDEEELAVFLTNTARLRTDRLEYGLGDRVEIIIEEPDFNLDSRAIDQVAFTILDIVTDKVDTEFGADPNDNFGLVINRLPNIRTNLTQFRETGFNSGVFTVAIEELTRDLIDRGEIARLLYFDKTPSGGGSEIRVQYTFLVVAILPEIVFDKEEYTPFDEVIVSIISPDSNQDPNRIETIRPLISSSSESLGRKSFPETGPNTGIFEEDFDLTPDKSRFPGDLRAIREDGVTVEFRIDSDTVATKSVFVNYHVGQVMFDKDAFRMNERGVVRVIDPDANFNPDTIDTLQVRFWSTTDRGGLLVTLRETGDRTGIFEEIVTFTPDEESSGTRLRVTEGDTITAKYTDRTLPAPAALDAQETFTVEVEELFASALIGAIVPPLERAVASEPTLVDQTGARLTDVSVGSQVLIQSTITNSQTKKQPFAYIVQIKDRNGVTVSLSWVTGELPAKESLAAAQSWIPDVAGEYTIEVFVWESVDTPTALSPVRTTTVTVR
jgi:hypothetical protein